MIVKRPIPCSLYDIQGMQDWLDEMARQGLFLTGFSYHADRAFFEVDSPRPVRYRLDPGIGRKDKDRVDPYAQMGWQFVARIPKKYYIFSCGDPDAPELYNDPQSLSIALGRLVKREIKTTFWFILGIILTMAALTFWGRRYVIPALLLWDDPQALAAYTLSIAGLLICLPMMAVHVHRLARLRDDLAQGLPPKAKKRWDRPLFLAWYIPLWLLLCLGPRLFLPDTRVQVFDLGEAALSHTWPTLGQLEGTGPRPLKEEPEVDGYVHQNDSWFVPVQEYVSIDWRTYPIPTDTGVIPGIERPYALWTCFQYDQARSPRVARWVYQIRRDDEAEALTKAQKYDNPYSRVTGLQPWEALDWPGLDRLEAVRYRQQDQDCWTLTALRGNEVLVVRYVGYAALEDCLPLFLEALDRERSSVS